jgi:HEAT repeat protein
VGIVAARALAKRGGVRHARVILEHLDRFDLWSPAYLSEMLAAMGTGAHPELARICLDEDIPPRRRAVAADALRQIGLPEAADVAHELLARAGALDDADERELVLACLRILAEVGRAEHRDAVRTLAAHPHAVVRALAATALGELGEPRDVALLVAAVDDPSRWVAIHAARALRSMSAMAELKARALGGDDRAELAREVLVG